MKRLMEAFTKISKLPETEAAEWLSSAESSVECLKENAQSQRTVLYASMPSVLIHAVLAPLEYLDPPDPVELSRDFIALDDSWVIEHVSGGGPPDRVYLAPPMHGRGKTFEHGEKLVFRRSFAGSPEHPIELSQKLVHALDLHFIPERSAYCRLDEDGDVVEVIKVVEEIGRRLVQKHHSRHDPGEGLGGIYAARRNGDGDLFRLHAGAVWLVSGMVVRP